MTVSPTKDGLVMLAALEGVLKRAGGPDLRPNPVVRRGSGLA